MIAAPWYLLSLGVVILLAGIILSALAQPSRPTAIDPRMSDEEIAENLRGRQGGSWGSLVVFVGLLVIVISLVWRMLRLVL